MGRFALLRPSEWDVWGALRPSVLRERDVWGVLRPSVLRRRDVWGALRPSVPRYTVKCMSFTCKEAQIVPGVFLLERPPAQHVKKASEHSPSAGGESSEIIFCRDPQCHPRGIAAAAYAKNTPQAYFSNATAWQKILLAERASHRPQAGRRRAQRDLFSKKCKHCFENLYRGSFS